MGPIAGMFGAVTGPQMRARLAAMREQKADLDRVIEALEALLAMRRARVVELVPLGVIAECQAQMLAWDDDGPPLAA